MSVTTQEVLASRLQWHGPGTTVQSDHQGIDAGLNDLCGQDAAKLTNVYFRRGEFVGGY